MARKVAATPTTRAIGGITQGSRVIAPRIGRRLGLRTSVTMASGRSSARFRAMANMTSSALVFVAARISGSVTAVHSPDSDHPVRIFSGERRAMGTFWKANRAIASIGTAKYSAMAMRKAAFTTPDVLQRRARAGAISAGFSGPRVRSTIDSVLMTSSTSAFAAGAGSWRRGWQGGAR